MRTLYFESFTRAFNFVPKGRFQLGDERTMSVCCPLFSDVAAIKKGLSRVAINQDKLDSELEEHYELLAEPVQTVMRKFDIPNPYEKLKDFTRGKA